MSGIMKCLIAITMLLALAPMGLADAQAGADSTAAGKGAKAPEYHSFSELGGKRVSMLTGAPFEELVRSKAPDVGAFSSFNNMPDMLLALRSNKTDAILINNAIAALAVNRDAEFALFPQNLQDGTFGFAFEKGDSRRDEWQAALDAIPAERIQAAWDEWTGADESAKALPEQDWPGANGTVRVAACDTLEPMSYVGEGGKLMGFDLEVILMIARELDVRVEFSGMEFSAILSSVQTGKADIGVGSIIITPERAESVDFVEYYPAAFVLIVRGAMAGESAQSAVAGYADLEHARIGVQTGTTEGQMIADRFPEAEISYFSTTTDLVAALTQQKIKAFPLSLDALAPIMNENDRVTYLPEPFATYECGLTFGKTEDGEKLRDEFNAFLEGLEADGALQEMREKWMSGLEQEPVNYEDLPATNGRLRMATEATYPPFEYVSMGRYAGFDVELAARFCEARGYGLEVVDMSFDAVLTSVQTGKCDFGASGIEITEERAQNVLFSEPYHSVQSVIVVLKAEDAGAAAADAGEDESFWGAIASSFEKTFVREERWRLFADGVFTTLAITLLAILFGTLLGFVVFMLCRNGNPVANGVTRFCLWLVQGMPMVVLLMILYYIIFGSVAINGIAVAVIGFTLTFGSAVFGLLKLGVGAVDGGQYEAAYALGYSSRRTFFRIILPQALPHVTPAYLGEIVSLIKATAIVGYIAVQDLTKMGDIVRSRTYEAFFPLIAVTVIYFVLEGLIKLLLGVATRRLDPRRRKGEDILKGIKTGH